ncbi:MAG TPA: methyltransferase domain-containing protein [Candidatus Acidoferrales bacterium]|nr:methyltransferase domain-containing protein [Candidatus Acidoferrales bacterium]
MAGWNPEQYLKFSEERTQPCRDLAVRVTVPNVRHVIDLGCGPGNSTQVLAERWPDAEITGLDSAAEMINAAIQTHPRGRWIVGDIVKWAGEEEQQFDVVFSSAALQWLPDHATLCPKLFARVGTGGAFAFQIPSRFDRPAFRLLREMAAAIAWRKWFPTGRVRNWNAHESDFYYDLLAPLAQRVDFWQTEYFHVLPNAEAIVEWYKSTGMRPYLQAIEDDADRERFTAEYVEKIRVAYPPRPDGRILFPFLRIFLIAYR